MTDAHEIQALIRYHCSTIVDVIDDDGIKPSKWDALNETGLRILELIQELRDKPQESS